MNHSGFYTIRRLVFLAILLGSLHNFSNAQVPDTFETYINRVKDDSLKIRRSSEVIKYYENIDTSLAWKYFRIAQQIAKRLNNTYGDVSIAELEGILYTKNKPAKAYALYQNAIKIIEQADSAVWLKAYQASLLNNLGVISYLNGDYEGAINNFSGSVSIYEQYGDAGSNLPPTLNNIATTYSELQYFSKAADYTKRAIAAAEKSKTWLATCYIGSALALMSIEQFDSALNNLKKARAVIEKTNNQYDLFLVYSNYANYYDKMKKYDSSLYYYQKAFPLTIVINSVYDNAATRMKIAAMQVNVKNSAAARRQIDTAESIINENNFRDLRKTLYDLKSQFYEETGNPVAALDYRKKMESLKDSLLSETRVKRIDFLEERYQAERKQASIDRLENEKKLQALSIRQKSILNSILIAGLLALAVIAFLLIRNLKHKQQLSKQTEQLHARRIKELEQEKQLISMNSLLKGQEEERGRLAKDLHDGLGGMLSGVKLSLGAMKGNVILTEENSRLFSNALSQLDNTIAEMRRVAHNMMPEALVRLGLQQAVQDYCDGLSESQSIKINYQFHGLEQRLDAPTEIIVYRIVQELLNNIIKHAHASEVFVQIMRHENNLNITVEDNGKGFDQAAIQLDKGAGLGNVRTRVDYLKGNLDIQSAPGKGTSIHIDCIVDNNG